MVKLFLTKEERIKKGALDFTGCVSMTKQEMKDECDINKIMERYNKKGQLPDIIKENPIYGDFSKVKDYEDACNLVEKAEYQFDNLPSDVRSKFDNEPTKFLEFVSDVKNKKEIVAMGLATEEKIVEPAKPVVPEVK